MIIDNSFVTIIIDYSMHKVDCSPKLFDAMFEELVQLTSYHKMIEFYSWAFTSEEYKEALFCALNSIEFKSDNEMALLLYLNLKRLNDVELLNKKVDVFNKYNFSQSARLLKNTLPLKTNDDMTVYFTFDGINGGSIIGDNEMMINFMMWPSDSKKINAIEGILLHEYHHIGIKEILKDRGYLKIAKTNKDIIKKLAISIVTEGIATYLFNQDDGLSELLVESHGEELANNYKKSTNPKCNDMCKLILKYNSDMLFISECNCLENANKYLDEYCFNFDGGEPIDKTLGVHICKTIDRNLGRDKLIELLVDPFDVIKQYNELASLEEKINCQFFV